MKTYEVELKKIYSFVKGGKLSCILMDCPHCNEESWKRPAVIVAPGGGYNHISPRESEPVATAFLARGFQTFVLSYTVGEEARYPQPLLQLSAAVDYVKKNAEALHVNPEEVFVVGFSAGGHLAGNLSVEHQNVSKKAGAAVDCKPTAVGLCYALVSHKHNVHPHVYDYLLYGYSEEEREALWEVRHLDEAVNEETPPAFLWATAEDKVVPPANSLAYAMALAKRNIPYEVHIYPRGGHGTSTGNLEVNEPSPAFEKIKRWVDDCAEFFRMFVTESF